MSENIIDFDTLKIFRKRHNTTFGANKECDHSQLEMEDHGEIVRCVKCKAQVSAYWALQFVASLLAQRERKLDSRSREIEAAKNHNFHLIAAKEVESAWRSKMAIRCPHCGGGIIPEDRPGSSMMSKDIEIRRRAVEVESKKNA